MSTALFSTMYGVLLKPLPFRNQNRLVVMWKADRKDASHVGELSYPEFKDWERQSNAFSTMAAMPTTAYGYEVDLTGHRNPVELVRTPVSARFFDVLGVHAALGRTFAASDDRVGAPPTVVLSHALWTDEFQSDLSLIGRPIRLSGEGYTVIGVMPAGFDFPPGAQLWTPLGINRDWMDRGATFLEVIGRLRPGASPRSAKSEIAAIITRVDAQYPDFADPGEFSLVTPLPAYVFGNSRPAILLLWAGSLLLLAIACLNIVSLLLARTLLREREIAVRASLGAAYRRLLRQFLAEGLVLSIAGIIGGCCAARILLGLARVFVPPGIPRFSSVHLNLVSLAFACGVAMVMATAFGCAPALVIAKRDLWYALGESGARSSGSRRGAFLRRTLLAAEATVTVVLLASAGMVVHNFYDLQRVPLGFVPRHVLTAQIRTPQMDPEQRNAFFTELLERLRSHSEVEAAGAVLLRPFEGAIGWDSQYQAMEQDTGDANRRPSANLEVITPGYFSAVGTPLVAGRDFRLEDDRLHPNVMIVSISLARSAFGGVQHAIGRQLGLVGAAAPAELDWRTIVGVVADAQYRRMGLTQGDIFLPFLQTRIPIRYLAMRTRTDPAAFAPVLREDVHAIAENLVVSKVQPMMQLIDLARTGPRFSMLLFAAFGIFAGVLAGVGVYGLVSDSAVQRRREMGIRMALGAQRRNILIVTMQNEMSAVALGGIMGLLCAIGLARVYARTLYGLHATDYLSAAMAFVVLSCVTLASSLIPILRSMKVSVARLLE
jgi:putative ABC transport system permease protein